MIRGRKANEAAERLLESQIINQALPGYINKDI